MPNESLPAVPVAEIRDVAPRRVLIWGTRLWIVTVLCLLVAIGLTWWARKPAGPTITIRFQQGHGIRPGNMLQHRGIDVGEVSSVSLAPGGRDVEVQVVLQHQAARLARDGSQFWIARPRLSLARVSGLETVVGAKYIGVQPGPEDSPRQLFFQGVEVPLSLIDADATEVEVRFQDGHGLVVGDPVKHRGITLGEVVAVDLHENLNEVVVRLRLSSSASRLARRGTQFWIERPTLSAAEIRGLETLVGGRYVAVHPAPAESPDETHFIGLNVPPAAEVPEGGLEFTLEADRRGGFARGVPLLYRGLRVGHVLNVGLANDSASIEARVWVDGAYRHLVRTNTRFWMNDGFDVSVGLKGVKLSTDTLSTVLTGGVSFATPTAPGEVVRTGHRFICAAKPEDEWLGWKPRLAQGMTSSKKDTVLPRSLRAALKWKETFLGISRERQLSGWLIPLADGHVLGPANLFEAPSKAVAGSSVLEAGGEVIDLGRATPFRRTALRMAACSKTLATTSPSWPVERLKPSAAPTDVILVTADQEPLAVAAARLEPIEGGWKLDPQLPLTSDQHGAAVVTQSTGDLVGVVVIADGRATVSLLEPTAKTQP